MKGSQAIANARKMAGWIKYDVWICFVNARTSYRATPYRNDDLLKPDAATGHLDTVWAWDKRGAINKAVSANRKGG